jgi:transposase
MKRIDAIHLEHHFPGFVCAVARLIQATSTIEIDIRPRRGSRPHCSCCGKSAAGYDVPPMGRFEFIPIWGYAVQLLYCMRRVQCRQCGVKVEQVPWGIGKHTLPQQLARPVGQVQHVGSRQEDGHELSFRTTWEQVCQAVEYVVQWGLEHRELSSVRAIGWTRCSPGADQDG